VGYFFIQDYQRIQKDSPYNDRVYIADEITDGFEMADSYSDVSIIPSESSTVSPTECPSVKPSGKVNVCPIY